MVILAFYCEKNIYFKKKLGSTTYFVVFFKRENKISNKTLYLGKNINTKNQVQIRRSGYLLRKV